MQSEIIKAMAYAKQEGIYADMKVLVADGLSMTVNDGNLFSIDTKKTKHGDVRVIKDEQVTIRTIDEINYDSITTAIDECIEFLDEPPDGGNVALAPKDPVVQIDAPQAAPQKPLQATIDNVTRLNKFVQEAAAEIQKSLPSEIAMQSGIGSPEISAMTMYREEVKTKIYADTDGSYIQQIRPEKIIFTEISVKDKATGKMVSGSARHYCATADAQFDKKTEEATKAGVRYALHKLHAVKPTVKPKYIVIDAALAGVFVHEAIGHAHEADHIINHQCVLDDGNGKLKKIQIAAPYVDVLNDARGDGWGSYKFDDEGVPGQEITLIKDGYSVGAIHSRATAAKWGIKSNGGSRAQEPGMPPIPRMSTTYIKVTDPQKVVDYGKNDYTPREIYDILLKRNMLKQGDDIFIMIDSHGGEVDPKNNTYMFQPAIGYCFDGSRLTPIDVSMSGVCTETLKLTKCAIGKILPDAFPGMCGKGGQRMPVGCGGHQYLALEPGAGLTVE